MAGDRSDSALRRGFTMVELLIVIVMIGILAAMLSARIAPTLQRAGIANASAVIALDLEQAVSLAARQRRPVRISSTSGSQTYTFTDRGTGAILFTRNLGGPASEYNVTALTFSVSPVDVFPSGLTSAALAVTITAGPVTRQITMSTGSFVRVVR